MRKSLWLTDPLLTTKLYIPPVRPELVPRPRLIQRLDEGLGRKLTLISAPAGFGKTTLLSERIHSRGRVTQPQGAVSTSTPERSEVGTAPPRVAWLSLDEGDNDLARFLTYFVSALQTVAGHIGQGLLVTLQSPGAVNVEVVLTTLLNEIAGLPGDPSP